MIDKKGGSDKPSIRVLDKLNLYHGPVVQKNWSGLNEKCMDQVGSKYGQSIKASLLAGKVLVTEIEDSILK